MNLFIKMNNKRTTINYNKCFHTLDVNLAGAFFNFISGLFVAVFAEHFALEHEIRKYHWPY